MGIMADGNRSLLKSGGEFFIKASQGGVDLVFYLAQFNFKSLLI